MSQEQKDDWLLGHPGYDIGPYHQPPLAIPPHTHDWRYDIGGRVGLRTCVCGKSYVLLALGDEPSLGLTWVETAEERNNGN